MPGHLLIRTLALAKTTQLEQPVRRDELDSDFGQKREEPRMLETSAGDERVHKTSHLLYQHRVER